MSGFIRVNKGWQKRLEAVAIEKRRHKGAEIPMEDLDKIVAPVPCRATRLRLPKHQHRGGFTLVELLVVIVIIVLVSAVALPVVLPALSHRQVSESARLLQGALAGARDRALQSGAPAGIRLIPDPAFPAVYTATGALDTTAPLAFSRWVPIEAAPDYTAGRVTVIEPGAVPVNLTVNPCLVIEESVLGSGGMNEPTSWFWNVRQGDKLQIGGAGLWYTVVGPIVMANPEGFVNVGPEGTRSPLSDVQNGVPVFPEFLFLVNGLDDNGNGYIDEGYDGVDNNADGTIDNNGTIDPTGTNKGEWEQEAWPAGLLATRPIDAQYTIRRRPAPSSNATEASLPTNVVIDATTWAGTRSRSRLPVDPSTGAVEIMVGANGAVQSSTRYGVPTAFGMDSAFLHFWLAERADVATGLAPAGEWNVVTVTARSGRVSSASNPDPADPFSAAQQGAR